jgi:hypothetical protein
VCLAYHRAAGVHQGRHHRRPDDGLSPSPMPSHRRGLWARPRRWLSGPPDGDLGTVGPPCRPCRQCDCPTRRGSTVYARCRCLPQTGAGGGGLAPDRGHAVAVPILRRFNLELHTGRSSDQHAPVQTVPLPVGSLRIADLGYLALDRLRGCARRAATFCRAGRPISPAPSLVSSEAVIVGIRWLPVRAISCYLAAERMNVGFEPIIQALVYSLHMVSIIARTPLYHPAQARDIDRNIFLVAEELAIGKRQGTSKCSKR